MKLPLILFILAAPVAFILLPYPFELLATIVFGGLFLLVTISDYVHADHVQHPEHYHLQHPAAHAENKSHDSHLGLAA